VFERVSTFRVATSGIAVVEEIKTHFLCSDTIFKSCLLLDNVAKYCTAGQVTDNNIVHAHCMLDT